MNQDFYHIQVKNSSGHLMDLQAYRGQVLLIVNVASRCGFTSQYATLQHWYHHYQSQGFAVLAFPCNQFAGQEPDDIDKIEARAKSCFAVSFPIFDKIDVKGEQQAPIYQYLGKHFKKCTLVKNIPWNFTKYLVDRNGKIRYRFWPIVPGWYVERKIKKLLSEQG